MLIASSLICALALSPLAPAAPAPQSQTQTVPPKVATLSDLLAIDKFDPAAKFKERTNTVFKPADTRLTLKAFAASIIKDEKVQGQLVEYFEDQIRDYEKDSGKAGATNDVTLALAAAVYVLGIVGQDAESGNNTLESLMGQCQSMLNSPEFNSATDAKKQAAYELYLCMTYHVRLMASTAKTDDDRAFAKSLANTYWKEIFGDHATRFTPGKTGLVKK